MIFYHIMSNHYMTEYINKYMTDTHFNTSIMCPFNEYDNLNSEYILLFCIITIKIVLIFNILLLCKRKICNLFKIESTIQNKKRKRANEDEKYISNKKVKLETFYIKKCYFCNQSVLVNTNKNKKIICGHCNKKSYVVKKLTDDMLNIILKEDRAAKKVELLKSKIFKLKKLRL